MLLHERTHYGNRTVDFAKEAEIKMTQQTNIIYRSKKSLFYYACNFIIYDVGVRVQLAKITICHSYRADS